MILKNKGIKKKPGDETEAEQDKQISSTQSVLQQPVKTHSQPF